MLISLVILNNKTGEIFKMAKFKVTIDTSKYKPCDKFATNRLMYAMDGLQQKVLIKKSYLD